MDVLVLCNVTFQQNVYQRSVQAAPSSVVFWQHIAPSRMGCPRPPNLAPPELIEKVGEEKNFLIGQIQTVFLRHENS
ncbi:MAG: hypothetical protein CSA33_08015 [Desulfobulbus propionicus]|nr:MAG: hypothetical protein CSA33_08015 [Desulfobulbus propionicus]